MLEPSVIEAAARRLHAAEKSRHAVRQISLDHPEITIPDAYAIQKAWVGMKLAEGRKLSGTRSA